MRGIDTTLIEIREEMRAMDTSLREEMGGLRVEIAGMRSDFSQFQTTMARIGFGTAIALLATLVTAILALA